MQDKDHLFREVMDFHPENRTVYGEIRANLDSIIPFVGAGLTAPVYGGWGDVLRRIAERITGDEMHAAFESMLGDGLYLEAAQLLEDKLGGRALKQDLVDYFSRDKLKRHWDAIQTGAIYLLPDLFACPVITTNFDEAIEMVYHEHDVAPFQAFDPTDTYFRVHVTRPKRTTPYVFKLHGKLYGDELNYDSLILTKAQYDRHYGKNGEARQTLRELVDARSMLFLGCSLTKDKTVEVLKEAAGGGTIHYAIASCPSRPADERKRRIQELADAGIRAIVYEDGRHDSVRTVLECLVEDKRATESDAGISPTALPSPAELIAITNSRLKHQQKSHPSFRLMNDDPAQDLHPKGKRVLKGQSIPVAERRVSTDTDKGVSFRDFVQSSWKSEKQTHLLVTGRGGIGKTVALLSFATEKGFLPKNVPTVYIPLYDLSLYSYAGESYIGKYLRDSFSENESEAIERLSKEQWDNGPKVILLLDGHNEVPAEMRSGVNKDIRAWAKRRGVQLVITSRATRVLNVADMKLELLNLSKEDVRKYLRKCGVCAPNESDHRLWQVLETPLMLKLYTDVEILKGLDANYLQIRKSDSAGSLVWNYLQRELWRVVEQAVSNFSIAERAAAILLTVPYVCWKMESSHKSNVDGKCLEEYVQDACDYWKNHPLPSSFQTLKETLESQFHSHLDDVSVEALMDSQWAILTEEAELLSWNGNGYSFMMHQSLRDGFTAIHFINVTEGSVGVLPNEFDRIISENVKGFLVDLLKDEQVLTMWKANRNTNPTKVAATQNLLRIAHARYGGDLTALDWSGMDLREVNLFSLKTNMRLELSSHQSMYDGTRLNAKCFMPQGHTNGVNSISFSPDNNMIASGSSDHTVRLWDAETVTSLGDPLEGHDGRVLTVSFSPDGTIIASGSSDHTIRLWDTSARYQIGEPLMGHSARVNSVCFSPDGKRIASGSDDGTIRLWDIETMQQLRKIEIHGCQVKTVCFSSPNGERIISGSSDYTLRIWNVVTGRQIHKLSGHADRVLSVDFSPYEGKIASGSDDGTIRLWDAKTGEELHKINVHEKSKGNRSPVRSVRFSPDGTTLASGCWNHRLYLWDVESGKKLLRIEGHGGPVRSVHFMQDGTSVRVASGSSDHTVRVWDVPSGSQLGNSPERHKDWIMSTSFSPDGKLIAGGLHDGTIRLWDSVTAKQIRVLGQHGDAVRSVCFSPDGKSVASGSWDNTVCLWDTETGELIRQPLKGHEKWVMSVCFSPVDKCIASGSDDGTVRLWDTASGKPLNAPLKHEGEVRSVCFSPDGKKVASGSTNGKVYIWDTKTGTPLQPLKRHSDWIMSICFSPDGKTLASGADNDKVCLWDTAEGRMTKDLKDIKSKGGWVRSVSFSPDGATLATGSDDGSVRLWDVATGRQLGEPLRGHEDWVFSVCFSPDGTTLASSSSDGTVRLWDLRAITNVYHRKHDYYIGTIEPLHGIDLTGFDLSLAKIDDKHDREILHQSGVTI